MINAAAATSTTKGIMRIGMIGGGVVGGGVYEIVMNHLSQKGSPGKDMVIQKLCVRDPTKKRDFEVDLGQTTVVSSIKDIIEDDSIDTVVEVMGGTGLAKEAVVEALKRGKHVVTANKALLAEYPDELVAVLGGKNLAFEAAVCGGIPIVHALQSAYAGDDVRAITGICNGTTNYMLCRMAKGFDYGGALAEAQDLGYAEADPTADVEGLDVRAKLCLLVRLATGFHLVPSKVPCTGITRIAPVDFEYATLLGGTLKLLGHMETSTAENTLTAFVSPMLVPSSHPLASVDGCGNAVAVRSANLGTSTYTGPGAGRYPTANSVVADLVRLAAGTSGTFGEAQSEKKWVDDYHSKFYVRIPYVDGLGIVRSVGELCERHGISIHAILQNPVVDPTRADFCLTTDPCRRSQVEALCDDVIHQAYSRDRPLFMPMLADAQDED